MARKILLADDSVTAQNMGRKILADAGYEVIAVNNGSAALKKIAELKPDLVILDVYMPGYSGLEVCQRLKESQETARIPVLLTVGKLEPFKPEEAQRVRAEGYIVKPFEASELLSALAKLEDKVVPRAEPSKPGRFARAIAAVDESDRSVKNEPRRTETEWKNRISFPQNKPEAEETVEKVDVAAFGPIGVPKDVSPAEVAAITAAAAQIQMAESATNDDFRNPEPAAAKVTAPQAAGEFAVEPARERFEEREEIQANAGEISGPPDNQASSQSSQLKVSGEPPAAGLNHRRNGDDTLEDSQDAPVTMAVATASAPDAIAALPRWTAVPVALENDEASISLDHEMQKAYAAFASADYATSAGSVGAETASASNSSISEAPAEVNAANTNTKEPIATTSSSEAATASEPEPAPAEPVAAPSNFAQPEENLAPAPELTTPVSDPQTATASAEQIAPEMKSEPAATAATASTDSVISITDTSEPKPDSETLKTTAAAWASWRQIRDTAKSSDGPENGGPENSKPEAASQPSAITADTAALAVAAGAEQALPEPSSAVPTENPSDVASIVDSVLAGLRPKLMEEITRKMAEKK